MYDRYSMAYVVVNRGDTSTRGVYGPFDSERDAQLWVNAHEEQIGGRLFVMQLDSPVLS